MMLLGFEIGQRWPEAVMHNLSLSDQFCKFKSAIDIIMKSKEVFGGL